MTRLKENVVEGFQESLIHSDFDLETSGVKYKDDIKIITEARKEMGVLFTKTHFSATAEFTCSRCLKEYSNLIERYFDVKYPLSKAEQFVDITQDIREEIILGYPVKFLCKPDCRGLCPMCGEDLNIGNCSCQMRT